MTDNQQSADKQNVHIPRVEDAQLIYDDLLRFCNARRDSTASILVRSQFLLLITASLYAAAYIAGRTGGGFTWQELASGLIMLPSVILLLLSAWPIENIDNRLDATYLSKNSVETWTAAIALLEDLAENLCHTNNRVLRIHRVGYLLWGLSTPVALILIAWAQAAKGV